MSVSRFLTAGNTCWSKGAAPGTRAERGCQAAALEQKVITALEAYVDTY